MTSIIEKNISICVTIFREIVYLFPGHSVYCLNEQCLCPNLAYIIMIDKA